MKKRNKSASAKLDWFTCNVCGHEFNRAVDYLLTNCSHIICKTCLVDPSECTVCKKQCNLIKIGRQLRMQQPACADLFEDPALADALDQVKASVAKVRTVEKFRADQRQRKMQRLELENKTLRKNNIELSAKVEQLSAHSMHQVAVNNGSDSQPAQVAATPGIYQTPGPTRVAVPSTARNAGLNFEPAASAHSPHTTGRISLREQGSGDGSRRSASPALSASGVAVPSTGMVAPRSKQTISPAALASIGSEFRGAGAGSRGSFHPLLPASSSAHLYGQHRTPYNVQVKEKGTGQRIHPAGRSKRAQVQPKPSFNGSHRQNRGGQNRSMGQPKQHSADGASGPIGGINRRST
eukprot:gene9506-27148_t